MTVTHYGQTYVWRVSTAGKGFSTPPGRFQAAAPGAHGLFEEVRQFANALSVFFRGGYAIHGTGQVKRLGSPASHGCVRLHPSDAATLYSMIRKAGSKNTRIVITQ